MSLDLDAITKGVGGVASVVAAVVAVRRAVAGLLESRPARRSTLKADADLLAKLPKDSAAYHILARSIDERITEQYPSREHPSRSASQKPMREKRWANIVMGSLIALGFGAWTAYLVRDGFTPWALLTGFFVLGGLGFIRDGMDVESTGTRRPSELKHQGRSHEIPAP